MPKINHEEYEVLKELDDKWKWIAVNGKGWLLGFTSMPDKKKGRWSNGEQQMGFLNDKVNGLDRELFRFIQSSDPEPYSIAKLIEEYENSLNKATPWTINFESEETEVKNIEWLKEETEKRIKTIESDNISFVGSEYYDEGYIDGMRDVLYRINQLDEPEVLSEEWISDNAVVGQYPVGIGYVVPAYKLQKLLVPEQEEVDRAYKDGYEKGKQHATERQSEETETVAGVLVDYLIASAKLKLALKMEVEELEE